MIVVNSLFFVAGYLTTAFFAGATNITFLCCSNIKNNVVVPEEVQVPIVPSSSPVSIAKVPRPSTPNPNSDFRSSNVESALLDEAKTLIRDTFVYGYFVFWVFLVHRRFIWQPYHPRMELEFP